MATLGSVNLRMLVVFGFLSFLQGYAEPTEGLISQPVRSLLLGRGLGARGTATFWAVISLPWALKPFLGLLTDFLPLGRSRRRGYLLAAGATASLLYLWLGLVPGTVDSHGALLLVLSLITLTVAMADVTTDALVVDWGRTNGMTGRYQAAQWLCLFASGSLTGTAGGALSNGGRPGKAFLLCALGMVLMTVVAQVWVRDSSNPVRPDEGKVGVCQAIQVLSREARSRTVMGVGAFLILSNFSPLTSTVLQPHLTTALGFSEQFFGNTISWLSLASMVAAGGYGIYGQYVPLKTLAYTSVVMNVAGNLVYLALRDQNSAFYVTWVVGLTSMTATLVQFELAARACPREASGTIFAALMAVSNLSSALATWLGGTLYEWVGVRWGTQGAFPTLVLAGSICAAGAWFLIPGFPPLFWRRGPLVLRGEDTRG
ncbi:MAG: hypothetical protein NVSMB9_08950 [Isosphaeraceae bacterium]